MWRSAPLGAIARPSSARPSLFAWSAWELARRRLWQLASAIAYNADLTGFFRGKISRSRLKHACVPGLNCYSCPGAVSSCPLGALQYSLGSGRPPLYVGGLLLLFGLLFGRAICSFLCPFGLIQELLHKLPGKKLGKGRLSRRLSLAKYLVLAVFVIGIPIYLYLSSGAGQASFCAWLCPAGSLEAGIPLVLLDRRLASLIGALFSWKLGLLAACLIGSAIVFRPFCRFICPLGALYSFFNRIAIFGVRIDKKACIDCGACVRYCKLDVSGVNDRECVRCGECARVCPTGAIYPGLGSRPRKRSQREA